MSEITREVIIDLLPAYFSGEASEQTRQVVEAYFERDPDFKRMAHSMRDKLLQSVPVSLPENHQMQTLRRARMTLVWRTIALGIGLAFAISAVLITLLAALMLR